MIPSSSIVPLFRFASNPAARKISVSHLQSRREHGIHALTRSVTFYRANLAHASTPRLACARFISNGRRSWILCTHSTVHCTVQHTEETPAQAGWSPCVSPSFSFSMEILEVCLECGPRSPSLRNGNLSRGAGIHAASASRPVPFLTPSVSCCRGRPWLPRASIASPTGRSCPYIFSSHATLSMLGPGQPAKVAATLR